LKEQHLRTARVGFSGLLESRLRNDVILVAVRQEGGAWFTESPQGPLPAGGAPALDHRDIDRMNDRLEELSVQNELLRLEQDWQAEQEQYLVRGRYGYRARPSAGTAIFVGVFAVIAGLIWMGFTMSMMRMGPAGPGGPGVFFPLFGLVFIAFGVGSAVWQYNRAMAFQRAEEAYQRRRRALLDRIDNPFRRDVRDGP